MPTHTDNVLVDLSTPIHPTPTQERLLDGWHSDLTQTDQALRQPQRHPNPEQAVATALDRHAPALPPELRSTALSVLKSRLHRHDQSRSVYPSTAFSLPCPLTYCTVQCCLVC